MSDHAAEPAAQERPLLADVVRSELAKLLTLRSTLWILGTAAAVTILAAVVLCEAYIHRYSHLNLTQLSFNPTSYSLSGVLVAQLAIAVLGVLTIGSEHATGMIRATFTAVPQRGTVLAGKSIVLSVVTLLVGEAASFASFFAGQAILAGDRANTDLGAPGVARSVIGAGLYLAVLALLALAIGTIVRHSAGAITVLFGLLLVLPAMTEGLPHSWQHTVNGYLPSYAGQAIFNTTDDLHLLPPWTGFAFFSLYTAAALALATILIRRRDT